MSELPVKGLGGEEQLRQMYLLMGKQVKSYHKAYGMGENTSVSVELAQELMESIRYTLSLTEPSGDLAAALERGQELLKEKHSQAVQLLGIVNATLPAWQGEARWDAIGVLSSYLQSYDPMHLAHREPDGFVYPLPVPEDLTGIDRALHTLRLLWLENEIMDAFPETALEEFWDVFCGNDREVAENQCQRLVLNGVGKWLICADLSSVVFQDSHREILKQQLAGENLEMLEDAAGELAVHLGLENARAYMTAAIRAYLPYGNMELQML